MSGVVSFSDHVVCKKIAKKIIFRIVQLCMIMMMACIFQNVYFPYNAYILYQIYYLEETLMLQSF